MSDQKSELLAAKNDHNQETYTNTVAIDIIAKGHEKPPPKTTAAELVEIARSSFKSGKSKPIQFRRHQLQKLHQLMTENVPAIEEALGHDLGRHRFESSADIDHTIFDIKRMLAHLDEWAPPQKPPKPIINTLDGVRIFNDPLGVVLIVGTWNFPVHLVVAPLAGAIAAGNCAIVKPSEIAQATASLLAELLPKYLDKRCFQVFTGGPDDMTQLLEEKFDYIFFTGSTQVGKIVHAAAAKHLTPVTLELGGKSPVYIDDTVDMEIATKRILWGKLFNAGQICVSPDYVLCTKEVQEKFLVVAKKVIKEWYGADPKDSPHYCRIVSYKHFDRLSKFLEDKNKVALGGQTDPYQRYIEPTVLVNVSPNDPVMQEEIFGPILPIVKITSATEAIGFINAREKPLALYVFTNSKEVKNMFLTNTSSGGVTVNDTILHFSVETVPFGGVGSSGMGRYHGKDSFDTFVHKKTVLEKNLQKLPEKAWAIRYPPFSDTKLELMKLAFRPKPQISLKWLSYLAIFAFGIVFVVVIQIVYKRLTNEALF